MVNKNEQQDREKQAMEALKLAVLKMLSEPFNP